MFVQSMLSLKNFSLKGFGLHHRNIPGFRVLQFSNITSSDTSLHLEAEGRASDEERAGSLDRRTQSMLDSGQPRQAFWTIICLFLLVVAVNVRLWQGTGRVTCTATNSQPPTSLNGFKIQTDSKGQYIQCPTDSSQSAREAHCHYDVMIYGWLPPACFDESMYLDVANTTDWGFFHDHKGNLPIPQRELMKGNYESVPESFVSNEEHWQHCRYIHNTSIAFRQRTPSTALDVHLDPHHMGHCLEFITNPDTPRSLEATTTQAKFDVKRRCYILAPAP